MRSHVMTCRRAASLLVLSVMMASSASAQLGKLKKIGADAIKDAATGKKPEPVKDPTAPRVDYVISETRLAAIISALMPLAAEAQREADARAVAASYTAKTKASTDCIKKAADEGGVPDMEAVQSPRFQALATRTNSVMTRMLAAQSAKRYREFVALADTTVVLQAQSATMMFKNSCAPISYKPVAMLEMEAAQLERAGATTAATSSNELNVPTGLRAGMTSGQFGRIRERMAVWALIQSGTLPPTSDTFTDEEKAALIARAADLKKLGPLFKAGAMQWATWGDIKAW